jgi:hypothetical protein
MSFKGHGFTAAAALACCLRGCSPVQWVLLV